MEKFTIEATVPGVGSQYGNLKPIFTAEAETIEKAEKKAMKLMVKFWNKYAPMPFPKKEKVKKDTKAEVESNFQIVNTFTGEQIKYDPTTHSYTTMENVPMISGSNYKKLFDKPFPKDQILPKIEAKYGVPAATVDAMWSGNSKISTTFGNAIHFAMEQWFRFRLTSCAEKEYHLPKHPFMRGVVESFPLKDSNILPEVFVSNIENGMVGQIDGLEIVGEKQCIIHDYKTDADIEKNIEGHYRQLAFYAECLRLSGWKVDALVLWNYTDKWEQHTKTEWEFLPIPNKQ